jgi:hypothetical protein
MREGCNDGLALNRVEALSCATAAIAWAMIATDAVDDGTGDVSPRSAASLADSWTLGWHGFSLHHFLLTLPPFLVAGFFGNALMASHASFVIG